MQRRQFIKSIAMLGGVTGASWLLANPHLALALEEFVRGPTVPDLPMRQISRHVWIIHAKDPFPTPENYGMMSNLTFVDTREGWVVVDSGSSVQIGEMAIRQLKKKSRKPVIAIINTHYHGDHWLGNHAFVEAFKNLPIYAHAATIEAVNGQVGRDWLNLLEKSTNQITSGTRIVAPTQTLEHGQTLTFGNLTLRMHYFGQVHTTADICVEVVEDQVTCVGDIAMDKRIANMDEGSYLGTFKAYDALEKTTRTKIWLPAHGEPGPKVLAWNRSLFEGIYETCQQAFEAGLPLEAAKEKVMLDPRVASRAQETKGFDSNIGKYVSLAYLEAERNGF